MPTHITARLAWHDDGWNGAVCTEPAQNTYCVGCKSFPGDVIARERDLRREIEFAGLSGAALRDYVPPCSYSYNAFGVDEAPAASNPPDFFFGGATRRSWSLKPATVCTWPYEAMYSDEVYAEGRLDNDARRTLTLKFFQPIIDDCPDNLIFYYANYSNPLSEEEAPRYVLVGVSRIVEVGEELFYDNVTPKIAAAYAGGMVWARDITSAYPDEGVRLPYHRYADDPETLSRIAVFPENPALCKYGSKHLTDDDAIGLLEQFLAKVRLLKEMNDRSENWDVRETWLLASIARLWTHRGLYPGLLKVLEASNASVLIDSVKAACIRDGHQKAYAALFDVLDRGVSNALTQGLTDGERRKLVRAWQLQEDDAQMLYREILPRLSLDADVMRKIADPKRADCGLDVSAAQIAENPYLIAELFCGADPTDRIPWSTIDRGVLPWPDLGGTPLADMDFDDARRFRALCVEHLRQESKHTFRRAADLVAEIGTRMDRLPEWKQARFNERYFKVDADRLSGALTVRVTDAGRLVYLKEVFEDERRVESVLGELFSRPDIDLRRPITSSDWLAWVTKPESPLALEGGEAYREATREQAEICEKLFRRPLGVVTGPAGTGKTTVIEALVRAVRRSEGEGASVLVLAPTGKAADRAREVFEKAKLTGVETVTVHSFLAASGWLNANLTFKRRGGKRGGVGTLVLDEASMLDLELAAALMRAVDWQRVRRLILVGDAGQLPPIGRGRLLADVIAWLDRSGSESFGRLQRNLRQMSNRLKDAGSSIVELSRLFVMDDDDKALDGRDAPTTLEQEELIQRIHAGGAIDRDVDVVFWNKPEELASILIAAVETKMNDGAPFDGKAYELWRKALSEDPTRFQILTPHRGELHGVEALNEACQQRIARQVMARLGVVGGVTLFDKVIQIRNRPRSNPIWAYDIATRQNVKAEVFNGEIGTVQAIGFDKDIWKTLRTGYGPRLKRFCVRFTRKPHLSVNYGSDVPHPRSFKLNEKVEENLELAYAVSIHKSQGSEFDHTFVVIPSSRGRPVSAELVYTALTRASRHCTLLIERDVTSLLDARRRENAQTPQINSSLFDRLHIAKVAFDNRRGWYEAGKIHEALSGDMLRSKSEVIIANLLHEREVPFRYELRLLADDGTMYLPDFTIDVRGRTYFWEHLGMLDSARYAADWKKKKAWYERWFPGQLVTTEEGPQLSRKAEELLGSLSTART